MKVFTVRDLDREPGAVLDVCDRDGMVSIRRRNGRTYTLRATAGPERMVALPDFSGRLADLFPGRIPAEKVRRVDDLMTGE